jgi:MtN3 and saliva related transmembrane protein
MELLGLIVRTASYRTMLLSSQTKDQISSAVLNDCALGRFALDNTEYLGLMASSLATLAFPPHVMRTLRTGSAKDFSQATLLMIEAGTSLRIVYGVLRSVPAIWLGSGVTLALVG